MASPSAEQETTSDRKIQLFLQHLALTRSVRGGTNIPDDGIIMTCVAMTHREGKLSHECGRSEAAGEQGVRAVVGFAD
jgi:hypothetical protein